MAWPLSLIQAPSMNQVSASARNRRVLIVDDNTAIHEDFRKILCSTQRVDRDYEQMEAEFFGEEAFATVGCSFEMDSAYQGQEALELVKRSLQLNLHYAVAFVDVRMPPGWDGVETISELWKVDPQIQIVICTAYSDYAWEDIFRILGRTERLVILKKPFDTVEVVQLAHSLSEKWFLARQLQHQLDDLDAMVNMRTQELQAANLRLTQEITEKSRVETALRHSEERFSKAFAASPLPMAIQTVDNHEYIDVNEAFLKMVGFTRNELVRRNSLEVGIWQNEEQRLMITRLLGRRESARDLECRFKTKSGAIRNSLVSIEYFRSDENPCALIIIHDISDRISLESQLRHSQKLEAVGQLASGVAHHFNNILSIVQGYVGLVLETEGLDEGIRDSLFQVMSASQRGATFTRQLLTFGRKQLTELRVLNLNDMLAQLQAMLPPMIGEHIRLECGFSAEAPLVYADSMEVEQIILNLALNARDAMPHGGQLVIHTELVNVDPGHRARNPEASVGRFACLKVTDTGCGMDEQLQRRIFEPFFTTKDAGKGSGLGLATVYGIVKELQGWIEVSSQVGSGSTFSVFLPACKPPGANATNRSLRGTETILLVEDEAPVRKLLKRVLEQWGYNVLDAPNGAEALKIWASESEEIKLLLSDIIMPDGMSGKQLASVLRSKKPELEVILTSGMPNQAGETDLLPASQYLFVPKPYSPESIVSLVRERLDKQRH